MRTICKINRETLKNLNHVIKIIENHITQNNLISAEVPEIVFNSLESKNKKISLNLQTKTLVCITYNSQFGIKTEYHEVKL